VREPYATSANKFVLSYGGAQPQAHRLSTGIRRPTPRKPVGVYIHPRLAKANVTVCFGLAPPRQGSYQLVYARLLGIVLCDPRGGGGRERLCVRCELKRLVPETEKAPVAMTRASFRKLTQL